MLDVEEGDASLDIIADSSATVLDAVLGLLYALLVSGTTPIEDEV